MHNCAYVSDNSINTCSAIKTRNKYGTIIITQGEIFVNAFSHTIDIIWFSVPFFYDKEDEN